MAEPRRVGKLHAHKLPDSADVAPHEVYRCECNKEFFVEAAKNSLDKKWFPLESATHLVEYDEAEIDAPRIGRWAPKVEEEAGEVSQELPSDEKPPETTPPTGETGG